MVRIALVLFVGLLTLGQLSAQEQPENLSALNSYKYVVVPVKFEMMNDADKYQLNSLTKFLFNKYGYEAYMENDPFPTDLRLDKCLALYVEVVKAKGGLLGTKLMFELSDCQGKLVTTSRVGKSREKEFRVAYNLALRNAFQTFQQYPYKYQHSNGLSKNMTIETPAKTTVTDKPTEMNTGPGVAGATVEVASGSDEAVNTKISDTANGGQLGTEPVQEQNPVWYAQSIANGYQIVDSTPKVVMILLETGKQNVFVVKGKDAIVYEEDGFWYVSENNGSAVQIKPLNIKF